MPMFTEALLTVTKRENNTGVHQQMSGSSKCGVYIYIYVKYYSTIKKK